MEEIHLALGRRKTSFLDGVERDVRCYIESTGKQCIAVVEKSPQGGIYRTWEVHLDDDLTHFCKVLYKFVRKETYNNHALDLANSAKGTLHTVGSHIGNMAAMTAGSQVATIVAHLLLKLLAANMSKIVAKILASTFLKKILAVLVKKFILAAVTTAVLHFLATHVGAAVGGSTILWIVLPLLAAYIGYKIATFPEKLGEKVSKKIRGELSEKFEPTNTTILEKIFEKVFGENELVQVIATDKKFQSMLYNLGKKMESQ